MGKVLAAVAVVLLAANTARAAPLEAYGKLPHIEDIAISPAGSMLAITMTDGEARSIILRDQVAKTSFRLEVGSGKLRDVKWVDEENLLITATSTARVPGLLGPRREYAQAFLYNRSSKQLKLLLRDAEYSLNVVVGQPVVRIVGGETKIFAEGVHFVSGRGRTSLFEIGLDGVRSKMVGEGFEDTRDWLVGPDGKPLAQVEFDANSGRWSLRVKSRSGWKAVKTITVGQDYPALLGLGRDGKSVLIGAGEDEKTLLQEYSTASEAWGEPFEPLADGAPVFDPATHALIGFQTLVGDVQRYDFFDPASAAAWAKIERAYKGQRVTLVSWSSDRSKVVVLVDSPREGPTYAMVDFTTGRADWIAGPYPDVPATDIAEVRPLRFKASDGLELTGYLTLPKGRDPKKLPLIVNPHGGPAARDRPGFDWWSQAMASRGYAVLRVNFRGSTGFGRSFTRAGSGEWGRKMQSDLSDGVQMLAAEGTIDPGRVCIVGASYGGYAALAGVTLQRGIYRCAASVAGVSDLRRMVSWSKAQNGAATQRYWVNFMGAEDARDPVLRELSPSEKAVGVTTPVLLVHGRDDTVVPLEQTTIMEKALKAEGNAPEVVIMPGEDHWLSRGETRLRMLQAVMTFVEKNNPPS